VPLFSGSQRRKQAQGEIPNPKASFTLNDCRSVNAGFDQKVQKLGSPWTKSGGSRWLRV